MVASSFLFTFFLLPLPVRMPARQGHSGGALAGRAKERNKEKQAGNDDSPFPGGFSIKLLNYCGEVHLFPDVVDWLARVFIQHSTFNINSNFYPSAFQLTTCNLLLTTCFIHFRDSSCVGMTNARLFLLFTFYYITSSLSIKYLPLSFPFWRRCLKGG